MNPARLALAVSGALYIVGVPITSFLTQPHGLVERAVNGVCNGTVYIGSLGGTSSVSQTSKIAALSALFITVTYAFTGAASSAGVEAAHREGRDNNHPRAQTRELKGLPLRLHSAHYHLMETFPGVALSAVLAQVMAPGDQTLINLLGLHVICKTFVYEMHSFAVPTTLANAPVDFGQRTH